MLTKLCVHTEFITCSWFLREHLHYVVYLLGCGAGGARFVTWCYWPRLSTWRLNLLFCFMEAVNSSTLLLQTCNLLGRTIFWPLCYWSMDIYFFCIQQRNYMRKKSNKWNCTDMVWLDVYLRDIALNHTTTAQTQTRGLWLKVYVAGKGGKQELHCR